MELEIFTSLYDKNFSYNDENYFSFFALFF